LWTHTTPSPQIKTNKQTNKQIIENVAYVDHVKWALQPIFAQNIHNPFQNSPKHMLSLDHVFGEFWQSPHVPHEPHFLLFNIVSILLFYFI
jgi:hypothetical protein